MLGIGSKAARDRRGNVALILALLAPVLILAAGGAVDVTNASMRQSQLQQSLDAAAVAAVARNSVAYKDALVMSGDGTLTDPQITTNAKAIFDANRLVSGDTTLNGFTVVVVKTGTVVSSKVQATATFAPSFLGMIGHPQIPLAAVSTGSDNVPAYIDFYLLLDNTPSMGLGATSSDVAKLVSATGGCAFACHATNTPKGVPFEDYYTTAKSAGVTMRIDIVRQATSQLMTSATTTENTNGINSEFRMAVYDFGPKAYTNQSLNQINPQTTDLTTLGTNISDPKNPEYVDLMTVPTNNHDYITAGADSTGYYNNNDQDTNIGAMMLNLMGIMLPSGGLAGNGSTALTPQQVMFIVTDGMADENIKGTRTYGGIDQNACAQIKKSGIRIAILYTTYLTSSLSDPWSKANVASHVPEVAPALISCASPNLYQEVTPDDTGTANGSISAAMQSLFLKVVASVKITG